MKATTKSTTEEMTLAREVVRFLLGKRVDQSVAADQETISFSVDRRPGWRLASIIFSRSALRKLVADPEKAVKLEYIRRDLMRVASSREEYRYPRSLRRRARASYASLACR